MKKKIWAIPTLFAFMFACNNPYSLMFNKPTPQVSQVPKISEKVKQLSSETLRQTRELTSSSIVFYNSIDQIEAINKGDIIIGEHDSRGFMRRVTGVSGDKKTIFTDNSARVEELADNFNISLENRALTAIPYSANFGKGISPETKSQLFDYKINTELDLDGNPNTDLDRIKIYGEVYVDSRFDLDLEVRDFQLKKFFLGNVTSESISLTAESSDSLSNISYTFPIAKYFFSPIVTTIPFTAIPFYVRPELDVSFLVQGNISPLSASLDQTAVMNSSVSYSNSKWTNDFVFSKSFIYKLPDMPDADFSFTLEEKLSLYVYEALSPNIAPKEYLTFYLNSAPPYQWQLHGGLKLDVGIDMGIFSFLVDDYNKTLIDYSKLLAYGHLGDVSPYKVLFASNRDGSSKIYSMNESGANVTMLAQGEYPRWSADRTKIAFASNRSGNYEIYIMNADGTDQTRLTNNSYRDYAPCWSPDGSKIVFTSDKDKTSTGYDSQLYIMNSNGTNLEKLITSNFFADSPTYSPDGQNLAYTGGDGIYKINPQLPVRIQLTNNYELDPTWSSGGILFVGADNQIYLMNSSGGNKAQITNSSGANYWPSWSKDESKIFFASNRNGNWEIYSINPNRITNNLTNNSAADINPN